jgi:hypothetical protein
VLDDCEITRTFLNFAIIPIKFIMPKHSFLIIFFSIFCSITSAQTPDWIWARQTTGSIYDFGESLVSDNDGNIYVSGNFLCCNIVFGNDSTAGFGEHDLFIAKYDNQGNPLWIRSAGGDDEEPVSSIDIDNAGNIYVTGYFRSDTMFFDSIQLYNTDTGPLNTYDIYLAKYDSTGTLLWAKSFLGNDNDLAEDIHVDNTGNIFITGMFSSDTTFFDNQLVTTTVSEQIYIAKLDSDGNALWAKKVGSSHAIGTSITSGQNGQITITGYFSGNFIQFTGITVPNNCSSSGCSDFYVATFDSLGNILWASGADGTGNGSVRGIEVTNDSQGNILLTGTFVPSSITFDTITLNKFIGSPSFGGDGFIVKYDPAGNVLWAQRIGTSGDDLGQDVITDADDNVYITGIGGGSNLMTCAQDSFAGVFRGYVAKFDSSGSTMWVKDVGGNSKAITLDTATHVYVSGYFRFTAQAIFGNDTLYSITGNQGEYFIAKLDSLTSYTSVIELGNINDKLTIYPNPFVSNVTLLAETEFVNAEFILYDLFGKKIKHLTSISGNQIILHREDLPAGMYFFTIQDDRNHLYTGKLIAN